MMSRENWNAIKNQSDSTPFTKNKKDLGNMNWLDFKENFIETTKYSMPFKRGGTTLNY